MDDLPIVHVQRPGLPWREEQVLTECGLPADGHPAITRAEFLVKIKHEGERRARYSTCQTCLDTAQRWPSWEEDPVRALYREVDRSRGPRSAVSLKHELLALAVLVGRHRDEFQELLEDQLAVVDLALRRRGH